MAVVAEDVLRSGRAAQQRKLVYIGWNARNQAVLGAKRPDGGAGAEAIEHHDSDRAPTILDAGDQRNRAVVQF